MENSNVPKDVELSIREIFTTLTAFGVAAPMGSGKDGIMLTGKTGKLDARTQTEMMRLCVKAGTLMTGPGYLIAETSRNPSKDVIGFYRRFPARTDI